MQTSFSARNRMDLKVELKKIWNIFCHLIDPQQCKTIQRQNVNKIIHGYQNPDDDLIKEIKHMYIGADTKEENKSYEGPPNP